MNHQSQVKTDDTTKRTTTTTNMVVGIKRPRSFDDDVVVPILTASNNNCNDNEEEEEEEEDNNEIIIMNQKTKHCRKEKKIQKTGKDKNNNNNNNDVDAYHMAYQNYQYRSIYFTYSNEAPGVVSLSFTTSKIIYHHHYNSNISSSSSTTATTTTITKIAASSSTHNSEQDWNGTTDNIISSIPSSSSSPPPPPGTPLCYYKASYLVKYDTLNKTYNNNIDINGIEIIADMIVHQHVNGLCVVCVANLEMILSQQQQQQQQTPLKMDESCHNTTTTTNNNNNNTTIQLQYQVQVTSSELSLAQKRKRNTKQLQGKKITTSTNDHNIGLVQPSDTLATLLVPSQPPSYSYSSSSIGNASMVETNEEYQTALVKTTTTRTLIQFPCCVLGSIIELNEQFMNNYNNDNESRNDDNFVPTTNHSSHGSRGSHNKKLQLLQSDPYLKGYLAIILPSGPFPPPHQQVRSNI